MFESFKNSAGRLTCIFLVCSLLAGCSGQNELKAEQLPAAVTPLSKNGYVSDWKGSAGEFSASSEEISAIGNMEKQLETDKAELYLNKTYFDIAVRDKQSGHIWFSNPAVYFTDPKAEATPEAMAEAYSQIKVEYYDDQGTGATMTSFPDAVDGQERAQVDVSLENGALYLTYTIGQKTSEMVIPMVMTPETYNDVISKAEKLSEQGQIMPFQLGTTRDSYQEVILKDADNKDELLELYPNFKKYGRLYVLSEGVTEVVKSRIEEVFIAVGWDDKKVTEEHKRVGINEAVSSGIPNFVIPVKYQLQGADLLASVDTSDIEEEKGFFLHKVSLLKNFGGAKAGTEGYIFLPDGSGSIIQNDVGSFDQIQTEVPFYGSDHGIDLYQETMLSDDAIFPVFGIKSDKTAMFSVVESGDAGGGVTASISDTLSSYNRAGCYFIYRPKDKVLLDQDINGTAEMSLFSSNGAAMEYRVRYHFLYGDAADYSGMANYYRNYLEQTGQINSAKKIDYMPLSIEFLGSIDKRKQILGFPVTVKEPLTEFKAAGDILERIKAQGIESVDARYSGWINGGIDSSVSNKVDIQNELGGISDFKELKDRLDKIDYTLYPAMDIARTYRQKNGNGFKTANDTIQYLNKKIAVSGLYSHATGQLMQIGQYMLVSPLRYQSLLDKFLSDYKKLEHKKLSVLAFGETVSGDYHGQTAIVSREAAKLQIQESLAKLKKSGYGLHMTLGNAYVLPYAELLTDVPLSSAGKRIEKQSVPFTAMVLHGSIPFTGEALNISSDYQTMFLKTIECGAGFSYRLMAAENSTLKDTDYEGTFAVSAAYWEERIVSQYKKVQKDMQDTFGRKIKAHERIGEVSVTTYDNGIRVYVNYAKSDCTIGRVTVEAQNYKVVRP